MALPSKKTDRLNLGMAEVMLACGDVQGLSIMAEMFAGFGVHTPKRCQTIEEAKVVIKERAINLFVVDSALADGEGYDLIHWLRRCEIDPNCFAPVVLVTGHTKPSQVFRGRDAGASFVVAKPVAPMVMMQRILWLLNDQRKFVISLIMLTGNGMKGHGGCMALSRKGLLARPARPCYTPPKI